MNLTQRMKAAIRAFQGKPAQSIQIGVEVKNCRECTRREVPIISVHRDVVDLRRSIETPDMSTDPRHLESLEHHLAGTIGQELLQRGLIDFTRHIDGVNHRLRLIGRVQVVKRADEEADTWK